MSYHSEHPGLLAGLTPCYWGSVNQWECDENDHLNVRFYAQKINQALQIFLSRFGDTLPTNVPERIRAQHIRFLRECRAAVPLRVDCAIAGREGAAIEALAIMHDNVSGDPVAAFVTRLDVRGLHIGADLTMADVPELARPRGLRPADLPQPPAAWDDARRAGFRIVGRGVIGSDECDATGTLMPHHYIGRVSDGMPNLWAFLNPPADQQARGNGTVGGAALEQRLEIMAPLAHGSVFTHLSGVRALGNKTQQMAHIVFDETHDRVAASVEAVGVAMDLETRKAVPISAERRRHLEALLLT